MQGSRGKAPSPSQHSPEYLKVTVVGDGNTGKTCLMVAFCDNHFSNNYEMTVFDNRKEKITVDGSERLLDLWDTAGQEVYANLRRLAYPMTKVFLLCFSLDHRASFDNVPEVWLGEMKSASPEAKVVLVGTKLDLRPKYLNDEEEPDTMYISTREGKQMKKRIGASSYVECSSMTREGVKEVFQEAVRSVYGTPRFSLDGEGRRRFCPLL